MYIYICIYICIYMFMYIYVCVYIYIYTYIYISLNNIDVLVYPFLYMSFPVAELILSYPTVIG